MQLELDSCTGEVDDGKEGQRLGGSYMDDWICATVIGLKSNNYLNESFQLIKCIYSLCLCVWAERKKGWEKTERKGDQISSLQTSAKLNSSAI